jgi:2-polyprenyl-3-methyl-5-hydroxy-6-metoxy-1,4-benzoquinol methylase
MENLTKSVYGYFSANSLPTNQELEEYYADKYYQKDSKSHSHTYTDEELLFFDNKAKVAHYITSHSNNKRLLDVGSGEGFFASHFYKKDYNVTTLDYSDYGILTHNPHLLDSIIKGDIFLSIGKLIRENKKYDLINLSNVLEHVIDPVELLKNLKSLLTPNSTLRISVPNDFSSYQDFLLKENHTTQTWISIPDHLHYFTFISLKCLLEDIGYEVTLSLGEFPIEIYLANESSNYTKNKTLGKHAHDARVTTDNFLFSQGIEKYINYYQASASIGFSRQVVIYAKPKS